MISEKHVKNWATAGYGPVHGDTYAEVLAERDEARAEIERLTARFSRLLRTAAAALERTQVDDAGEATMILEQVVTLSGEYVHPNFRWPEGYQGPNPACMSPGCPEEARYQFGLVIHDPVQSGRELAGLGLPSDAPRRLWYCHAHACHVIDAAAQLRVTHLDRRREGARSRHPKGGRMPVSERDSVDRDVLDRFPSYGVEGCVCGNIATPDPDCPLHFAIVELERLERRIRAYAAEADRLSAQAISATRAGASDA